MIILLNSEKLNKYGKINKWINFLLDKYYVNIIKKIKII